MIFLLPVVVCISTVGSSLVPSQEKKENPPKNSLMIVCFISFDFPSQATCCHQSLAISYAFSFSSSFPPLLLFIMKVLVIIPGKEVFYCVTLCFPALEFIFPDPSHLKKIIKMLHKYQHTSIIFLEDTHIPLSHNFYAVTLICAHSYLDFYLEAD